MEAHYIIKRPMLSEKGTASATDHNRYLFEVSRTARKDDISRAVQSSTACA